MNTVIFYFDNFNIFKFVDSDPHPYIERITYASLSGLYTSRKYGMNSSNIEQVFLFRILFGGEIKKW